MAVIVTRRREAETGETDRYGKPIVAQVETQHRAHAFAPSVQAEQNGVELSIETTGGTLYFRSPHFTEALPDDVFVVRGVEYEVDGRDAFWEHPSGVAKGSVIVLTRAGVTNG